MEVHLTGDRPRMAEAIKNLFGPGVTPDDVALAAGGVPGSVVTLGSSPHADYVHATVEHPHLSMFRAFYPEHAGGGQHQLVVNHMAQEARGPMLGTGYRRFREALGHLRRLGVARIDTSATSTVGMNGHYTWPRLGFDGELSDEQLASLPDEIRGRLREAGRRDLHALFALPGGPEAWKTHGSTIRAHFDTHPESEHSKRFEAYHAERERREAGGVAGPARGAGPGGPPAGEGGAGGLGVGAGDRPAAGDAGAAARVERGLRGLRRYAAAVRRFARRRR